MNGHWTHRTIATALLAFLIVFGWKVSVILTELQTWQGWDQPHVAGEIVQALVCGCLALGLALGLNFGSLLRGFGIPIGSAAPAPTPGEPT